MASANKVTEYEQEIENLCNHIKNMEDEIQRLTESRYRLDQAFKQNEKTYISPQGGKRADTGTQRRNREVDISSCKLWCLFQSE